MRNRRILLILLCLFALIDSNIIAQNQQDFNKVFEKETADKSIAQNKGKFKNIEILSYYPDTLPNWFFSIPNSGSEIYAIGISDPDMEQSKAKELAILRAKSNALLFRMLKYSISEIYTHQHRKQGDTLTYANASIPISKFLPRRLLMKACSLLLTRTLHAITSTLFYLNLTLVFLQQTILLT